MPKKIFHPPKFFWKVLLVEIYPPGLTTCLLMYGVNFCNFHTVLITLQFSIKAAGWPCLHFCIKRFKNQNTSLSERKISYYHIHSLWKRLQRPKAKMHFKNSSFDYWMYSHLLYFPLFLSILQPRQYSSSFFFLKIF